MPPLSNRLQTTLTKPLRPTSGKIIFISCEGQITEEEYFNIISTLFDSVKSKIKFISVMGDILSVAKRFRTPEQSRELTKSKPWQLVEKIDTFKDSNALKYDFANHPDDEFWIIADVDQNTNSDNIQKWEETLDDCDSKHYGYAISNPFFEIWLLLHHVDVAPNDFNFAVTNDQPYKPTNHFRLRLRHDGNAPLEKSKHPRKQDYTVDKVKDAISRAKALHAGETNRWPTRLGSTAYILLEKIIAIADQSSP